MTDRELLELAAKAAEYQYSWSEKYDCLEIWADGDTTKRFWQPHRDDGDALRLAAALSLHIEWRFDGRVAVSPRDQVAEIYIMESSREDRCGNLRRAIVRCAAEIQRQMETK